MEFDAFNLLVKELQLVGSLMYGGGKRGPEFRGAVTLLARYKEEIQAVQTHQFKLDDIEAAFTCANDKQSGAIKVTVLP